MERGRGGPVGGGGRKKRGGERRGEKPVRVGGLLERLLEKWGLAEQVERAAVLEEWEQRVGERVAQKARPVRLDGDTLIVEVESASWLMELQMMKRELLKRINAGRDRARIEKIVLVQGGGSRRGSEDSGSGSGGEGAERDGAGPGS